MDVGQHQYGALIAGQHSEGPLNGHAELLALSIRLRLFLLGQEDAAVLIVLYEVIVGVLGRRCL